MGSETTVISPGDKIGYHPVGGDDARWVGIVRRHYGGNRNVGVIVSMTDDPGIEEKVPYDRIEAHSEGEPHCLGCGTEMEPEVEDPQSIRDYHCPDCYNTEDNS